MVRFLVVFALALWPVALHAACDGRDLTNTLDAGERARLDTLLAGQPHITGNHWRATRDDAVLHLVGTIHVDDPRLEPHADALRPLIGSASRLLLEMTTEDRRALQTTLSRQPDLLLLPGATLPERLPEEEWARIARAVQARGVPPFVASKMRPWYLSVLLSMPACLDIGRAAAGGMDSRLEQMALAGDVPVAALEDPLATLRMFESVPIEDQIGMLRAALTPPAAAEDLFETVMASYLREAHAEVWALSAIVAERAAPPGDDTVQDALAVMHALLLEGRNRAWIPVLIEAATGADGPVVAAFGAAHLGGDAGVLALLEAQGFALERQPF